MKKYYVAIGSNIDPETNIRAALDMMRDYGLNLKQVSRMMRTKPVGNPEQPDFINCAVVLESDLSHNDLRNILKSIEIKRGRPPGGDRYGPRTLDLDIVMVEKTIVDRDVYHRRYLQDALTELGVSPSAFRKGASRIKLYSGLLLALSLVAVCFRSIPAVFWGLSVGMLLTAGVLLSALLENFRDRK